uniref:hypothetical protein n=1 Tax=Larkinella sp. C7 TaxID=2576607 RepID=UPI001BB22E4E
KNNLVTSESKGYHSDEQGNWYYADGNGNKLTGAQIIDSVKVYFDENGIQVNLMAIIMTKIAGLC